MYRMSSCVFLNETLSLRMSLRMNPRSNERRVQQAFRAREACLNRSDISIALDWSPSLPILKVVDGGDPGHPPCLRRNGHNMFMFRARNPQTFPASLRFRWPLEEEVSHIYRWRFASIYCGVPHSSLPCVKPILLVGCEEFANCTRGFCATVREIEKWKEWGNKIILGMVWYI